MTGSVCFLKGKNCRRKIMIIRYPVIGSGIVNAISSRTGC